MAAVGGVALLAAFSGGGEREPATLDEYFPRVQALHEEQEQRSEALGERFSDQLGGIESHDQALAAMRVVLPDFLPEFRSIIEETCAGLDSLEPPVEVRIAHADLLVAYAEFAALIDDAAARVEHGETGEEVIQLFMGERAGTELGVRFSAIAGGQSRALGE